LELRQAAVLLRQFSQDTLIRSISRRLALESRSVETRRESGGVGPAGYGVVVECGRVW
jgi:hypothetical protein